MKPTYYLKKNPVRDTALIILSMRWPKNHLHYSTRRTLEPEDKKFWLKDKQRIDDNNTETHASGLVLYNDFLDSLARLAKKTYMELQRTGKQPTPAMIKTALDEFTGAASKQVGRVSESGFYDLLEDYCVGRIKTEDDEKMRQATINGYKLLRAHLLRFDPFKRLTFDDIDMRWKAKFKTFLETEWNPKKSLGKGTIKNDFDKLKAILRHAHGEEISTNTIFTNKNFRTKAKRSKEADKIFLTVDEIETLYRAEMPDRETELIRDYFVLATQTGLRFGDWNLIGNAVDDNGRLFLNIVDTEKDGKEISILCTPLYIEIFNKYKKVIPPVPEYYRTLDGITRACRVAKLKNADDITTHTGRRSKATNMYLADLPMKVIMSVTGHTTEAMARKYIMTGIKDSRDIQLKHEKA